MYTTLGITMIGVGVCFIITSLILMIVWKVPSLIDDLSGRKAKRQIARMRELSSEVSTSSKLSNSGEFYKAVNSHVSSNEINSQTTGDLIKSFKDTDLNSSIKNEDDCCTTELKGVDVNDSNENNEANNMICSSKKKNIIVIEEQTSIK